ncbi:hypothetical protein A3D11_01680 [Candidatus Peribacteria bacterium RIFCSPHIGHO2_02_FULL_49_16]|nr:MAG: hypothetical protein A3D11_01680 [Candidatus Peribacteria bacterium RIFCSPHIGHO2_02_FULL_49_16]
MAIESSPFSRVELTGTDAQRFYAQIRDETPNPAAVESLRRGRAMVRKIKEDGTISIPIEKR